MPFVFMRWLRTSLATVDLLPWPTKMRYTSASEFHSVTWAFAFVVFETWRIPIHDVGK
jgi:hypothetical protein